MKLVPLGGGHQIGGSAYYLELDGLRVLIDAGLTPGRTHQRADFDALARLGGLEGVASLDAVVVTHSHLDHVGGLLDLLTQAPEVPVYMHAWTAELARTLFERMPGIRDPFGRYRGWKRFLQVLEENHARGFDQPFWPARRGGGAPVEITLLEAGHLPGAACIRLRSDSGCVLFTGDFNDRPSRLLPGTRENPAFEAFPVDLLVAEGTYAGRAPLTGPGFLEPEQLAPTVGRVIDRQGAAVIPAFAMGRAQEVLALLADAMADTARPRIPVWYDPLTAVYCDLYERFLPRRVPPGGFRAALELPDGPQPSVPPTNAPVAAVLSSGMLQTGTPAARQVMGALQDPRSAVILTGYQASGTLGSSLQAIARHGNRPEGLYLAGQFIRLRAEIYSCRLSAHADHAGLVDMVRRTRARRVVLVHRHGEQAALEQFAREIAPVEVLMPGNREAVRVLEPV